MYQQTIRAHIDKKAALSLLQRAVGIPSVTGEEAAFARFVAQEMNQWGASNVQVDEFLPGRANARGVWQGQGRADSGAKNLMVLGHLDTVHVRGWQEHWAGTSRESPFAAPVIDGAVWGRGTADLKGGICAALAAVQTLQSAGIRLKGDVHFVFPCDEESGEVGSGVSAGIKDALPHIAPQGHPTADFAIYVEPTQNQVYVAQMGFFIADITLIGKSAYFGVPEQGIDALQAAHQALTGLWNHSAALGQAQEHPLLGKAFLLVTEIKGGGYIAVPEKCQISLIRKLLPGDDLDVARVALEDAVRSAIKDERIEVQFAYPAGRDHAIGGTPVETDNTLQGVSILSAAARNAMEGKGKLEGAPYWSEAPFTTRLGIPTVYFAPGDIATAHTMNERVPLDEYYAAIETFAMTMIELCGVAPQP
jgi:acetylornithine deacetylase/succinyl-diaminopimelate desuccinylase-like protein